MRIIFFGTSDYCLPVLESLHKNFDLKLVVTRPDRPVGRKGILTPSATKVWAKENKIPVAMPETLKKDTEDRIKLAKLLNDIKPDVAVVSDYGLIIPEKIFTLPKFGTVNIHFSKLPDLRGPSPVQFALLRGDKEAWITIFKLENPPELEIKMDSGPIIFQQPYPILSNDTTETLYRRLFIEVAKELTRICNEFTLNKLPLITQEHKNATFCRFLTKDDGFIEWKTLDKAISGKRIAESELPKIQQESLATKSVSVKSVLDPLKSVYNFHRAMTPWPGIWTLRQAQGKPQRMIIRKCHIKGEKLVLDEVQFEGKKPISWTVASRGV